MKNTRFISIQAARAFSSVALLLLVAPAFAASTWSDMGNTCSTSGGTPFSSADTGGNNIQLGNSASCGASSSVTLNADAFSTAIGPTTAGTVFATAEVHKWGSAGLGIVNRYEDPNSTGPHAVDNVYGADAIRLSFTSALNLTGLSIGWNGTDNVTGVYADSDLSVLAWTGPGTPGDIAGKTLGATAGTSTLLTAGWTLVGNYADVGLLPSNTISISSGIYSSYWLVSAYSTAFGTVNASGVGSLGVTGTLDAFKLLSVAGGTQPPLDTGKAPEPGSLALFGLAFTGMMAIRRRKLQPA